MRRQNFRRDLRRVVAGEIHECAIAFSTATTRPLLDRERQLAVLERERLLAEQFAPPAVQRRHVGIVVGGDAVEIVDGGDHLGGDAVALRGHAQQHLEQFDRGARRSAPAAERSIRGSVLGSRARPRLHRLDDRLAPVRALEALRQRAQVAEPLDRGRRLHGDVADDVVLEHARARHVAASAPRARARRRPRSAPPAPSACARASSAAPRRAPARRDRCRARSAPSSPSSHPVGAAAPAEIGGRA